MGQFLERIDSKDEKNIINDSTDVPKWDCLLLTARNEKQRNIFLQQLQHLRLKERNFCKEYIVLADKPEGVRIGSGGATLNALLIFEKLFGNNLKNARLLLLHSGGLSQRIPHVALTGKAFMLMPDGKTLFEHKLIAYRKLLNSFSNFGGFLFITSADVLEYFPNDFCISNIPKEISLFLIAHQSNLDVATQHGVYVLKEKEVYNVLQKPSIEQLKKVCGAILEPNEFSPFETALTDSCYIIGPEFIENLIKNRKENGEVICELCCYRDFLCPIGSAPNKDKMIHFMNKNVELFKWQQILWNIFNKINPQIISLGTNSFFHFGTVGELLEHFFDENSAFKKKFLPNIGEIGNLANCLIEKPENISQKSFLEWCRINSNCTIEDNCILSGVVYEEKTPIYIKSGMCICTFPIGEEEEGKGGNEELNYVTVIFHIEDDLKRKTSKEENLKWFGHSIKSLKGEEEDNSLWNCPLFSFYPTASKSFLKTIERINFGLNDSTPLFSIAQVLEKANVNKMLKERKKLLEEKIV
uniref:GDP-fucose pyrophosphorylase domain-containing protein n=1 Tax=Meloidogyne enterolobii TaxID=390850 RepID=A0A6V7X4S4_MELEN|nr:unnamed protein product [Meloidogyne enterolobii]